jgi:hypothetical protein
MNFPTEVVITRDMKMTFRKELGPHPNYETVIIYD